MFFYTFLPPNTKKNVAVVRDDTVDQTELLQCCALPAALAVDRVSLDSAMDCDRELKQSAVGFFRIHRLFIDFHRFFLDINTFTW